MVIIILGLAMASMFVGLDRLLSRKAKPTPLPLAAEGQFASQQ